MNRSTAFNGTLGILLAGTHPWAVAGFDSLLPRTLLPVAHRPLIWYGLSWLYDSGIREVAVCGNRETRLLEERLTRHVPYGLNVTYHQDPMPRGAAGSVRDAVAAYAGARTVIVADGTSIPNVDLRALLKQHRESGAGVTVVVHPEQQPNGNAVLHAPCGIYVFERRAFDNVSAHGFCDLKETLIPQLHAAGERILPFESREATPRVLNAPTYLAVNEWMIEQLVAAGDEQDGYAATDKGLIHRDAIVADDATLIGPVIIGPDARLMSRAVVVGPASIGRGAVIETGAFVSRSAVWRRVVIGDHAVADHSIITDGAIVEPHSEVVGRVVMAQRPESQSDWRPEPQAVGSPRPSLQLSARIGRLVFGSGWSRSPAVQ